MGKPAARATQAAAAQEPPRGRLLGLCGARALPGAGRDEPPVGSSANSLHFWPGRGLNTGLKSALSLARTLRAAWQEGAGTAWERTGQGEGGARDEPGVEAEREPGGG